MRIVGGEYRGRRFNAPKNIPARPTTDFAKESLFNIINNRVDFDETKVLDLCAGIGSISFEFISRGVISLTSVDLDARSVRWLNQLCSEFSVQNWQIQKSEVIKWLKKNTESFDLIFADPPYDFDHYDQLISESLPKLNNNGLLVLEHRKNLSFAEHPNFVENRSYGEVSFSFFQTE